MKTLILSLFLFISPVKAETYMFPIQDLTLEIPNFTSPNIDLNSILSGNGINIENPPKAKRDRKAMEKRIESILYDFYPEIEKISFWNGMIIIKTSEQP